MTQFCTMPPLVEVIEATKHLAEPDIWHDLFWEHNYAKVIELAEMKLFAEDKQNFGKRVDRNIVHALNGSEVFCSWYGEHEIYYIGGIDRKKNNLICNRIANYHPGHPEGKRMIIHEEIPLSLIKSYKTLEKIV